MTTMTSPSFEELARSLEENGFCIWRGLFNDQAVDVHLMAYETEAPKIDGHFLEDKSPAALPAHREAKKRFYDADKTHEALCFEPQLLDFLRIRFGDEPVLRLVGTHLYSVGSHLHADCLNTTATDPWEHELRIWGALEDVGPASGPIYFYPKSHNLISRTIREEMLVEQPWYREWLIHDFKPYTDKAKAFYKHMEEKMMAGIERHGLECFIPAMKKGDALIFNPAVLHGTMKADDPSLTRKCIIFNYFAKQTPFYATGSYWGESHDYRCPENQIHFEIGSTQSGLRVINYLETCKAISERKVHTSIR